MDHPAVSSSQPFADAAMALAERGLAVIPCPGDDGKSPRGAIRGFHRWKQPPEPGTVLKMASQWGDANIGIVTSLSGVTVVDVDGGEALAEEMVARAGDTPLITRTPSLGYHLWYRSSGERNANLRSSGLAVDVKAGAAGIVIVPPSFRRSTGNPYVFERGNWDDLARLPVARPGSLSHSEPQMGHGVLLVPRGRRNDTLFRRALREARCCDDADALVDVVCTLNDQLQDPLSEQEALKIAMNAWRYESSGENWVGREARAIIPRSLIMQFAPLKNGGDALMLYSLLQTVHGVRDLRGEPFAVAPAAMTKANVMGSWSARRLRNARQVLLDAAVLQRVKSGGAFKGDCSLFRFNHMGSEMLLNVTKPPLP